MPAASGRKQPTHTEKVLARLKKGPATHLELYGLGVVAHSRIADLRRDGHVIPHPTVRVNPDGSRDYIYQLVEAA